MLGIATPIGTFNFSNITSSNKSAATGKLRLGRQETEKEKEQYNLLFNSDIFSLDGVTVFQEIENFKNRFPAKVSNLSIIFTFTLTFSITTGTAIDTLA